MNQRSPSILRGSFPFSLEEFRWWLAMANNFAWHHDGLDWAMITGVHCFLSGGIAIREPLLLSRCCQWWRLGLAAVSFDHWGGLFFMFSLFCLSVVCILDVSTTSWFYIGAEAECNWYLLDFYIFSLLKKIMFLSSIIYGSEMSSMITAPEPWKRSSSVAGHHCPHTSVELHQHVSSWPDGHAF
jgi:hypothetical protein